MQSSTALFQTLSIPQIHAALRNIEDSAQRKTAELRSMVGESYRDVIDAADAIGNMHRAAYNLPQAYSATNTLVAQGPQCNSTVQTHPINTHPFALAAKIKMLHLAAYEIWASLDSLNQINAALLYLLSSKIHVSLLRHGDAESVLGFANQQWEILHPLNLLIIQESQNSLKSEAIGATEALDGLSSLVILGALDAKEACSFFISVRNTHLEEMSLNYTEDISKLINRVHAYFHSTIRIIHCLFALRENGSKKSYFREKLELSILCCQSDMSHLFVTDLKAAILLKYASDDIFTAPFQCKIDTCLSKGELSKICNDWILSLGEGNVQWRIMDRIQSGLDFSNIYNSVYIYARDLETRVNHKSKESWSVVCADLFDAPDFSFWDTIISNQFSRRSKVIINEAFKDICDQPRRLAQELQKLSGDRIEMDDYVWTQNLSDLSKDMKCRTQIPAISAFESEFETSLNEIKRDLQPLWSERLANNLTIRAEIVEIVENSFYSAMDAYRNELQQLLLSKSEILMDQYVLLAAACRCISQKLEMYHNLFELNAHGAVLSSQHPQSARSRAIQLQFFEMYLHTHELWISGICDDAASQLKKGLASSCWKNKTLIQSNWESVKIASNTADQQSADFEIKVPIHPSVFISLIFSNICREINRVSNFLMHESLLVNLMKQLANVIITILFEFQSITGQEDISESGAIQLLFDTLVITKMFKLVILNELEQQFTKLVEWLQMLIDPVDFSIIQSQVTVNVTLYFARIQTLFGPLLGNSKFNETKRSPGRNDQHNVIPAIPTNQLKRFMTISVPGSSKEPEKLDYVKRDRPITALRLVGRSVSEDEPVRNSFSGNFVGEKVDANTILANASSFISGMWAKT